MWLIFTFFVSRSGIEERLSEVLITNPGSRKGERGRRWRGRWRWRAGWPARSQLSSRCCPKIQICQNLHKSGRIFVLQGKIKISINLGYKSLRCEAKAWADGRTDTGSEAEPRGLLPRTNLRGAFEKNGKTCDFAPTLPPRKLGQQ